MANLEDAWIRGLTPEPKKEESSLFQPYADAEGFILVYVARSYMLLHVINPSIPDYYKLAEEQVKRSPQMAEELYKSLREGMELSPEEFAQVHSLFWVNV
jgi:hypothetical protein